VNVIMPYRTTRRSISQWLVTTLHPATP
jgi:hypothetical protein